MLSFWADTTPDEDDMDVIEVTVNIKIVVMLAENFILFVFGKVQMMYDDVFKSDCFVFQVSTNQFLKEKILWDE